MLGRLVRLVSCVPVARLHVLVPAQLRRALVGVVRPALAGAAPPAPCVLVEVLCERARQVCWCVVPRTWVPERRWEAVWCGGDRKCMAALA